MIDIVGGRLVQEHALRDADVAVTRGAGTSSPPSRGARGWTGSSARGRCADEAVVSEAVRAEGRSIVTVSCGRLAVADRATRLVHGRSRLSSLWIERVVWSAERRDGR